MMSPASPFPAASMVRVALGPSADRLRDCRRNGVTADPEAIHLARVATRRLRANLKALRGALGERWDGDVRQELAWIGGLLGAVRDADVLAAAFEEEIKRAPDTMRHGGASLLRRLGIERDRAQMTLYVSLDGARFATLISQLDMLVDGPAGAPEAIVEPPVVMAPAWRALKRPVGELGREPSDGELHAVRIATKRARYAAEMFATAGDPHARRFVRRAARLQEALGGHHDAAVAVQWLLAATPADAEVGLSTGWLAARFADERDALRQAWRAPWEALRSEARFW